MRYMYAFDTDITDLFIFSSITIDILNISPESQCEFSTATRQFKVYSNDLSVEDIITILSRYNIEHKNMYG